MKKNMGLLDRSIRSLIAVIIAILYFTDVITGTLGIILLVVACVLLLTSLLSFCPAYWPFGVSTCKNKEVV